MADDPHRDLLPVKEGSCINTCRSSVIEHRERHAVCKLDRYQLEDRYLRLLDEIQDLKKLSNTQEDKIKRLATKLMRVAATPRSCIATARDSNNDRNRVECLEHENAKLKDKITVLRNQILNHKIGRSRSQRLQIYPTSGPGTFRSEIGRAKSSSSHLIHNLEDDRKNVQNYLGKIEELEEQKKEMTLRIADLESDLENHQADKQREKVAENVEFIRVWRQMKQQNAELESAQSLNVSLTVQIRDLKEMLTKKTRSNKEITEALMAEKKKLSHIDEEFTRAKSSQLSLREKDEQIKDLMSEIKILHQHNAELIALSSKYSQVQRENGDLKKKISEQVSDHQSLKSAFSNEQANITALQAANEQLMRKLHDLQRNIDSLTIQLKSFQSQNERRERSETEFRRVKTMDRETNTNSLPEKLLVSHQEANRERETNSVWKNCCQECRERISKAKDMVNREMQTEFNSPARLMNPRPERVEERSPKRVSRNSTQSPMRADRSFQPDENGSVTLMPEEMLKLLEQAQINTSNMPNEYLNSTELSQRQRDYKYPGLEDLEGCLLQLRKKKIAEMNRCAWRDTCIGNDDCGYPCSTKISKHEISELKDNYQRYQRISNGIQKTFDNIHMSRGTMRADGRNLGECYKSCDASNPIRRNSGSSNEKNCNVCQKTRWNCVIEQSEHQQSRGTGESHLNETIYNSDTILPCSCCDKCGKVPNEISHEILTRDSKYDKNRASLSSTRNFIPQNNFLGSRLGMNKHSSQRNSTGESLISTSIEQSESSVIRAMEDEDATSEDVFNGVKKHQIGSEEQLTKKSASSSNKVDGIENAESESVKEFNSLIRDNTVSSPRESRSSIQDLRNVFTEYNWHEYRRRSMANRAKVSRPSDSTMEDKAKDFSADTSNNNNAVIIRIESLSLAPKCNLLEDTDVHRLYVEFSFLGYVGFDMETISVRKPIAGNTAAYFNYMRRFEIDGDEHQMQRSIIRAMMNDDDNPTIKFIVISEPLPEHEETRECIEVGYAYLNVREHILSGETNEVSLKIFNNVDQTDSIGTLKVALLGAEAIRRCIATIK